MSKINKYLFQPFNLFAGKEALISGVIINAVIFYLAFENEIVFDGVLDIHILRYKPDIFVALGQLILNILILSLLLFVGAKIYSKSNIRFIDFLGTQAFARWPLVFAVTSVLILPDTELLTEMLANKSQTEVLHQLPLIPILIGSVLAISSIVYFVYLSYHGFSVSANMKGKRAVLLYAACLIITEILTKLTYYLLINL